MKRCGRKIVTACLRCFPGMRLLEVFMGMKVYIQVFWIVKLRSVAIGYQGFRGP
jgi:hypothetical protein